MTFKWVVNAGHSYNTSGKRSPDGMKEYEFNRAVANYIKEITYAEYEGVEIFFPHSDVRDVPLQERTDYANRLGADCWTGIHANAYGTTWNDANGIETFVYVTRPERAYTLALGVQRELVKVTGLINRGVKTGDLHEVRETHMDAILCECGFMTNQNEASLLKSDDYRRKVACAIVTAHAAFYGFRKKLQNAVYIYTDGYAGESLVKIHNFCLENKFYFEPNRKVDGFLGFTIGKFVDGTESYNKILAFLKENNFWYDIR